ncbi:MAG: hypothetical protein ABIQ86_06320 [Steroidobacteraceae bacterium]
MKHAMLKWMLLMLVAPAGAMEPVPAATTTAPAAPATAAKMPAAAAQSPSSMEPAVQTTPLAGAKRAEDRLELDATQITGNRELPRVLYVVPWKRSDLGDLTGRPVKSLLDEVLAPVDRDVFRRQNRYYQALKPDSAGTGKTDGAEVEK